MWGVGGKIVGVVVQCKMVNGVRVRIRRSGRQVERKRKIGK